MENIEEFNRQLKDYSRALLQSGLEHEQATVRFAAAEAFAGIGESCGIEELQAVLHHEDATLRDRAVTAIGNLKSQAPSAALKELLEDPDPRVRGHALEALILGHGKKFTAQALTMLDDPHPFAQECAVVSLKSLPHKISMSYLEEIVAGERGNADNYMLRLSAACYLAGEGNTAGQVFLYGLLNGDDRWLAFLAARNLAEIEDSKGAPVLLNFLEHGDWQEKIAAIEGLLALGMDQNVAQNLYRPAEAPDMQSKLEIIRLLDKFQPDNTWPLLAQAYQSEDEDIKIRVIQILGKLGRADLPEFVRPVLEVGPEHLRAHLLNAVEEINSPVLIPLLFPLLDRSYFLVRLQTARVILKITMASED